MNTEELIQEFLAPSMAYDDGRAWINTCERLAKLQPDKPEDGTTGFLAFNQPGKTQRVKTKTGRFLRKKLQLTGVISESLLQDVTTKINQHLFPDIKVEICAGQKITENYSNAVGGNSCMTGSSSEFTELYEMNPEKFSQLVMFWDNESARAIVHKLDNGEFLLGRVYGTTSALCTKMEEYAADQGWIIAGSETYMRRDWVMSNLEYVDGRVPYMDTLINYSITACDNLSISYASRDDTIGELCETNGYLGVRRECDCCGARIQGDDDEYGVDDGEYTIVCERCYSNEYFHCELCECTARNDDSTYIASLQYDVCSDCLDDTSVVVRCSNCDEYHLISSLTTTIDDDTICEDCIEAYVSCCICGEFVREDESISDGGTHYCEDHKLVEKETCND